MPTAAPLAAVALAGLALAAAGCCPGPPAAPTEEDCLAAAPAEADRVDVQAYALPAGCGGNDINDVELVEITSEAQFHTVLACDAPSGIDFAVSRLDIIEISKAHPGVGTALFGAPTSTGGVDVVISRFPVCSDAPPVTQRYAVLLPAGGGPVTASPCDVGQCGTDGSCS